jgi:hypothetical protein
MSLDLSVTNPTTGQQCEMNWLRNPYGLERWARANYRYVKKKEPTPSLWDVCNIWAYENAVEVNRPLFLSTVQCYGEVILALEQGYFWFDVSASIQFVEPHLEQFPRYDPLAKWGIADDSLRIEKSVHFNKELGIPMEYFGHPCFHLSDIYRPHAHTLAHYQDWYRELIQLAEVLQDPETEFSCSN